MKKAFPVLIALLLLTGLAAPVALSAPGVDPARPFGQVDEIDAARTSGTRLIVPERYRTVTLDRSILEATFREAPVEFTGKARPRLDLPLPDGTTLAVEIERSPIMAPELARRYPDIRTFRAFTVGSAGDTRMAGRLGWTSAGFHAILFTDRGTVYIDRYGRDTTAHYISYFKHDYRKPGAASWDCGVQGDPQIHRDDFAAGSKDTHAKALASGTELRTYRLAMAANYEYTQFHSGPLPTLASKSAALNNGIIPTMNRVNAIYERDVAVTMVLIPNEEDIIWDHPGDPYTNEDGLTMLEQNRVTLNALVGNENYDIGHVFSTGGGGIAGLGVVCRSGVSPLQNHKAYGVTGSPAPIGDPFDVDFVAHEIGHQFGANHTFNGNAGSCSGGNRNAGTAYEVGSGTTIMAYAGICGAQNVQLNSDDHFHLVSILEMVAYSTTNVGNDCPVTTSTGNTPPVVDAGADFTIPMQTPFTLTAVGSDADGDALTYAWEEFDLGPANDGATDNGSSPIFRAFSPTPSPSRTFPQWSDILDNVTTYGETLPTTNRVMNFHVTVRDNRLDGGGVEWDEMDLTVTTSAGPFLVELPNGGELWTGGELETVMWDVAGTTSAPVSTPTVNIYLSTDGGLSFPILLAAGVPNDGAEDVLAPNVATGDARIMVQGNGNVFFDVSNAVFTIEQSTGPPVAVDDRVITDHNTAVEIDVLANDTDPDDDPLSIDSVVSPTAQGGTAIIDGNVILYTPALGFDGVDTFDYVVSDGDETDTGTVEVVVRPACPPTATGSFFDDFEGLGAGWTVDTDFNGNPSSTPWTAQPESTSTSPVISFVSDASTLLEKDDRLIAPAQSISSGTHLTFWHRFGFEDGFDGGVLEVSFDAGQNWQDVIDAGGVFLSEGYNSTISGGFGSRIAGRDAWSGSRPALPTNQNQFQVEVDLGALNPNDLEISVLFRWRLVGDPFAAGATPGVNWVIDDVTFTNLLEPGICTGPVAVDDEAETTRANAVTIDVVANDFHPASESFDVDQVNQPANGSAADNGDGTVTYTPDAGFVGLDSFTYTICDLDSECDTATVRVQVNEGNRDPIAGDDSAATGTDQPVTIDVLANDSDPDGDPLAISRVQDVSDEGGSVRVDDNGTPGDTTDDRVEYTPAAGFFGTDTFTYTIVDGQGGSAQGVVTVTVDGCPDDPEKTEPGECGCGVADTDSDGDGTADCNDGCPADAGKTDPGVCGCGVADTDSDGDGTADCDDGCPADPGKTDPGVCGCGVADTDSDGDGTADCNDGCPADADKTDPGVCGCGVADTDSDGDGTADCDDGCPDDAAKTEPGACGCGVADTDSDGDGTPDCNDGCPADADKTDPGECGCGVADTDSDGDGTADCIDGCPADAGKTNPGACGCGVADTDSDGDGTADCIDGCPADAGKTEPGVCGCGVADTDSDGDGTPDCEDGCPADSGKTDPGICGCGTADTDSDGDGTADCDDGCPTDASKTDPGTCGCGVADTDSDGDGTADCNDACPADPTKIVPGACGCGVADTDSDGDGTADCDDACPSDPDKTDPGECGCGVAEGTCPTSPGSGRVHGAGLLLHVGNPNDDDSDSDNISFNIQAEYHRDGSLKGKLKLRDKSPDVKIDAKTILTFGPGSGTCNGTATGPGGFEFTAEGKFNGQDGATFRVCGEDRGNPGNDDDDSDSDSDSDAESKFPDRLYIECLSGCSYNTASRTDDDIIDAGNIKVSGPIVQAGSKSLAHGDVAAYREAEGRLSREGGRPDGRESTEKSGLVDVSGPANGTELLTMSQVLELGPMLQTGYVAGTPLVLTTTATAPDGISLEGRNVTLRWRTPDGTRAKATALIDAAGIAVFPVTVQPGTTVYHVRMGRLGSNRVVVTGQ